MTKLSLYVVDEFKNLKVNLSLMELMKVLEIKEAIFNGFKDSPMIGNTIKKLVMNYTCDKAKEKDKIKHLKWTP